MRSPRMARTGSILVLAILLAGILPVPVSGSQAVPAQGSPNTQGQGAKPPSEEKTDEILAPAPVDPHSYKIGAEDILNIRVWREPEMSGNVVVRPDGKITLLLVGEVQAAGLTPAELGVKVTEVYGKILTKPEINIAVISVRSKRYYISGKVGKSGAVPLVTATTILQALSASGLDQWAKKSKIVIMRGTERLKFNYDEVIKGKKLEQNVVLHDGDHIFVP